MELKNKISDSFKELSSKELVEILGLTIKRDEANKLITFLCQLSAYTEDAQFNVSYNAPSSTGKSFIPTEVARLFPAEDVIELGYCSPTAFFHDKAREYKKERNELIVDLSRKIIIFLDQPHTMLLEHLRPFLSHDKKEIHLKITDKSERGGLRTKNILLRGFPAVTFCTAKLAVNEQEATRFLLLSPEISQEKIREGISETIKKEADSGKYKAWLEENPERKLLKERIAAIRQAGIETIKMGAQVAAKIRDNFLGQNKILKPRNQRDIKRLLSIVKAFALLNLWWRERDGKTIIANEADFEEAFKLWGFISPSQEFNLPPHVYDLYQKIIVPLWDEKRKPKRGINRQELLRKHLEICGYLPNFVELRQQSLPMLETAGLIVQESDPDDKRRMLIYPATQLNKSVEENNSVSRGGVNNIKSS